MSTSNQFLYTNKAKKVTPSIIAPSSQAKRARKIYSILFALSFIAPCMHITATTESALSFQKNIPTEKFAIHFSYTFQPYTVSPEKCQEEKSSIEEDQGLKTCNFMFTNEKYHIGETLVIHMFKNGRGTIKELTYRMEQNDEGDLVINNQSEKPNVKRTMYPPVCPTCYTILQILYPKVTENKNITYCQKRGCQGTVLKSFTGSKIAYHLPVLAGFVETNLSNDHLLKKIGLPTTGDNKKRMNFEQACHQGLPKEAEQYLEDIKQIGLHNSNRVSAILGTCCAKHGFIKVIKSLLDMGAMIDYLLDRQLNSPITVPLAYYHEDSLSYVECMLKKSKQLVYRKLCQDNRQISFFDLLFQSTNEQNTGEVIRIVKYMLTNIVVLQEPNMSKISQATLASDALLACSCSPGFGELIKILIQNFRADINYTDNIMSAPMRAVRIQHTDAINYCLYMDQQQDIDWQYNETSINFFDLLSIYVAQKNRQVPVMLLLKSMYKKRQHRYSDKELKRLVTYMLNSFCDVPNCIAVIKFCILKKANLNYIRKGENCTIPIKILLSSRMTFSKNQQNNKKLYNKEEAFEYLTYMIKNTENKINYNARVKDNEGACFSFLEVLVLKAINVGLGERREQYMHLISILKISKKDAKNLEKSKKFNIDSNGMRKRILEMGKRSSSGKHNNINSKGHKKNNKKRNRKLQK